MRNRIIKTLPEHMVVLSLLRPPHVFEPLRPFGFGAFVVARHNYNEARFSLHSHGYGAGYNPERMRRDIRALFTSRVPGPGLHARSAPRPRAPDGQSAISTGLLRPRASRRAFIERVCGGAARYPCALGRHCWLEPRRRKPIAFTTGRSAGHRSTSRMGLLAFQVLLAEPSAQRARRSLSLAGHRTGEEAPSSRGLLTGGLHASPFFVSTFARVGLMICRTRQRLRKPYARVGRCITGLLVATSCNRSR